MSSKQYPHLPYFYIITHKKTGVKYAGSRWTTYPTAFSKNGATPEEFLVPNGYHTSSPEIRSIIDQEGLESFTVNEVFTLEDMNIPFGCNSVYEYESWFLKENDCARSIEWFNKHNNLGSTNPMEDPEAIKRSRNTNKKTLQSRYGVDYIMQLPHIVDKANESRNANNTGRYGVRNVFQLDSVKDTIKKTPISKYGVDNYAKTEEKRKSTSEFNKSNKLCIHCGNEIKFSIYMSKHGDYCKDNPNQRHIIRKTPMANIKTGEIRNLTRDEGLSEDWGTLSSFVYTVYDDSDNIVVENVVKFDKVCDRLGLPRAALIGSSKTKNRISSTRKSTKPFNGWYATSVPLKEYIKTLTLSASVLLV